MKFKLSFVVQKFFVVNGRHSTSRDIPQEFCVILGPFFVDQVNNIRADQILFHKFGFHSFSKLTGNNLSGRSFLRKVYILLFIS